MSRWWPEAPVLGVGRQVSAPDGAARAQQLDQALADFDHALGALAMPRRGARQAAARLSASRSVQVQLAGGLTRWQVLPFNDSLRGEQQHHLFAQHCFVQACGERARHWTIQAEPARWQHTRLACGIDAALLDALAARARLAGRRLGRVEPALTAAHNAVRGRLNEAVYWFALVEDGLSTALLMAHGQAMRIKPMAPDAALGRTLDREWFALGLQQPRCPVVLVGDAPGAAVEVPGWTVIRPDLPSRVVQPSGLHVVPAP